MRRSLIILGLLTLSLAACNSPDGGPGPSTPTTDQPVTQPTDAQATGVVAVHLEEVQGFFIEGFEVGLRFETSDGTPIAATLWSDFIVQSHPEPKLEDFYTSVFEQTVPAGPIVLLAEANVGIGPGPVIPDVDGELRCTLELDVPAGGRVDVEVTFSGDANCLRQG
jgi:hypothetical protein